MISYKINKVIHKVSYSSLRSNFLIKDIIKIRNNPKVLAKQE